MKLRAFGVAPVFIALLAGSTAASLDPELGGVLTAFDHDEHPDLRGIVVLRDGRLVAECYSNGETPDALHDVRSAGKSVTSLLVGIALDRGELSSVDDPVSTYWPEAKGRAIGDVAIKDLLTMRSGLAAFDDDPASPGAEDRLDAAPDPLAFVLSLPRADRPGSLYRYNSVTAYTVGVVVAMATDRTLADFAQSSLFEPLGIRRWKWAADAAGYTKGQGNLSITARELATIGEMLRNAGKYHGRRIVSAAWV